MGNIFLSWLMLIPNGWIYSHIVTSTTRQVTIDRTRSTLDPLGLPEVLIADNGMTLTTAGFGHFQTNLILS